MKILAQSVAVSALFLSIASAASAETSSDILEGLNSAVSSDSSWRVTADGEALEFSGSTSDSFGTRNANGDISLSTTLDEKIKEQPSSRQSDNPWKLVGDNFVWKFNGYANSEFSEGRY